MSINLQKIIQNNLRELVFGLEDGLVSTLGVVTGMASGLSSSPIVILSGLVVVLVESLSMAAGTYLSNKAEHDLKKKTKAPVVLAAFVMFFAYVFGGSIPLLPYFFMSVTEGIKGSIVATVVALFMVGYYKGQITKTSKVRSGLEMVTVSLMAAGLGYFIGQLGSKYLDLHI
jgi:vacuolar iron transporter family protein